MASPGETDYSGAALINPDEREGWETTMKADGNKHAFVYMIKGRPAFAYGDIYLQQGQRVIADSKGLLWMDGKIDVETGCVGGPVVSFLRQCAGEPCCMNTYVGTENNQKVTVGFELPGDIVSFAVTPKNGWVMTKDAFVAGTDNLLVSTRFSSCFTWMCGDEGAFLTKVSVPDGQMGVFMGGGYGMIERHDVPEGTTLIVSRGLFFAAREDTEFEVSLFGQECLGLKNVCCTGGGIVMKFHGPCVVYTQARSPIELMRMFGGYTGSFGKVVKILLDVVANSAGG
jgi:uncharacterized protein (TIGR00266 family)